MIISVFSVFLLVSVLVFRRYKILYKTNDGGYLIKNSFTGNKISINKDDILKCEEFTFLIPRFLAKFSIYKSYKITFKNSRDINSFIFIPKYDFDISFLVGVSNPS